MTLLYLSYRSYLCLEPSYPPHQSATPSALLDRRFRPAVVLEEHANNTHGKDH